MGGEGDLKAAPGEGRARHTGRPRGVRGSSLLSSHISPVWPVSDGWRAVAQRAAAATGPRGRAVDGRRGRPQGGTGRRPRAARRAARSGRADPFERFRFSYGSIVELGYGGRGGSSPLEAVRAGRRKCSWLA
jgi:hypothetical protein